VSGDTKDQNTEKSGSLAKKLNATLKSTRQIVANFNAAKAKQRGEKPVKKT